MIKKILIIIPLILISACQAQSNKTPEGLATSQSERDASASARLEGPEQKFAAENFGWNASIPENWQGYLQTSTVKGGKDYIIVANYDPDKIKKKPDDYHEIKVERLEAGEDETIKFITDNLLEGKNIEARKLLFTKEYQGNRTEYSDAKGATGLMTMFRQANKIWVLTYSEVGELDGQSKWVYQRLIETFKITG